MVKDRRFYSDTFWFTLFHEVAHIINGDYGITFENDCTVQEDVADRYTEDKLIPPREYEAFVSMNEFSEDAIRGFAKKLTEIQVLSLVVYKMIRLFCLRMSLFQEH